jgi:peptide/nickel transport system permease protein
MAETLITTLSPSGSAAALDIVEIAGPSPRRLMLQRARGHFGFMFGGTVVALMILVALFAPEIARHGPYEQDLLHRLADPVWGPKGSWAHPFGTDALGRDVLSRLIYGTRISLTVGFAGAAIAGVIGSLLGLLGGYFGGRVDAVVIYLTNVKLALPIILVSLAIISISGPSLNTLILILGFLTWDRYALVTRSATQQLRRQDFVLAAQAAGASNMRIMLREVLPNLANHIIIVASLEVAVLVSIEAALSFLGLGVPPPTPSWGVMIAEGRAMMFFKPHLIVIPGMAIFFLVVAINLLGDGIRDVTAPEGRA